MTDEQTTLASFVKAETWPRAYLKADFKAEHGIAPMGLVDRPVEGLAEQFVIVASRMFRRFPWGPPQDGPRC